MRYSQKYLKVMIQHKLNQLPEEDRIYLNVEYTDRWFARHCHCGFDTNKKIWFTGCKNTNIDLLIDCYGIHDITSDKARHSLKAELKDKHIKEEMRKQEEYEKWERMHID